MKNDDKPSGPSGMHGIEALFEVTRNVPTVTKQQTTGDVRNLLMSDIVRPFDTINYVYTMDDRGKLIGAISLKLLLRLPSDTNVFEASEKKLITATASTTAEHVAIKALRHNLKAIPIVNSDGHFFGVMASDTILHTLRDEAIERVLRSVGMANPRGFSMDAPLLSQIKQRIPWLLIGLSGSFVGAYIINSFGSVLKEQIILAAFIPVIAYITGAVGVQVETIYIRSLALNHATSITKYILKQLSITFSIAVILATLSFSVLSVVVSPKIGIIFALTMLITITFSTFVSALMPWGLSKLRIDPAIASGPFSTTIRDVTTILIYLTIATTLIAIL